MILITETFKKDILKISSVTISDIQKEIEKHSHWLKNMVQLWEIENRIILKSYLNSKKVRCIISFTEYQGKYFPFFIVRKETKHGKNITKSDFPFLQKQMQKHRSDILEWKFEIIQIQ